MTTQQNWALFVGTILPAFLLWMAGRTWPALLKSAIAIAAAIVVAIGTTYITGGFTKDLFGDVLLVIVGTWAAYEGFWQHVGKALVNNRSKPIIPQLTSASPTQLPYRGDVPNLSGLHEPKPGPAPIINKPPATSASTSTPQHPAMPPHPADESFVYNELVSAGGSELQPLPRPAATNPGPIPIVGDTNSTPPPPEKEEPMTITPTPQVVETPASATAQPTSTMQITLDQDSVRKMMAEELRKMLTVLESGGAS